MMTLNANPHTGLFVEKQRLHEMGQEIEARRMGNTVKAVGFVSSSERLHEGPKARTFPRLGAKLAAGLNLLTL